jgi:hypothetical protein
MMATRLDPTADYSAGSAATADTTGRHPCDARLRRHGFAILRRPSDGPAVWVRGGKEFTEAVAEKICDRAERFRSEKV